MENNLNKNNSKNSSNTNVNLLNEISSIKVKILFFNLLNFLGVEQNLNAISVNTKDVNDNLNNNESKLTNNTSNDSFIKKFLNSDAEFAAYLGILDIDPTTVVN